MLDCRVIILALYTYSIFYIPVPVATFRQKARFDTLYHQPAHFQVAKAGCFDYVYQNNLVYYMDVCIHAATALYKT